MPERRRHHSDPGSDPGNDSSNDPGNDSVGDSPGPVSSRESRAGAGWECAEPGSFHRLMPPGARPLSWLSPVPLLKSRNDLLARAFADPTNAARREWVDGQVATGVDPDFTVRATADRERAAFLVLGDPGEGDASQYCLVPGLLNRGADTDFLCIASDVIYPAGGVNEYETKFYRPYERYPAPIYAVPGNHDWYDGLHGFMRHFCGARRERKPRPDPAAEGQRSRVQRALHLLRRLVWCLVWRLVWRAPPAADEEKIERMRELRGHPGQRARQPGPYFALEAGPLLLVGIDTGITGQIDREQGAWLERVSRSSTKPKILLTGTPLYADAQRRPVPIEGTDTSVDDIVREPAHRYLAAIGGDRHNYQRYPVRMGTGRTIQYIVSGGGGAFLHDTHAIPYVDLPGVSEGDFRCYPLRSDSLSMLSQTYRRKLGWLLGDVFVPPDQAAAMLAQQHGQAPVREGDRGVAVSPATRRGYCIVTRLPRRFPGMLQEYVQRFFDRNDPPLFRSFLRVDASADEITIRCFAATGCRAHEVDPPLEDTVRCVRDASGEWRWEPA